MLDVINFIEPHKVVYIELYKAYQIACAIPVTTAETERSFSCMKRVKTYLRSTMGDDRFAILFIQNYELSYYSAMLHNGNYPKFDVSTMVIILNLKLNNGNYPKFDVVQW